MNRNLLLCGFLAFVTACATTDTPQVEGPFRTPAQSEEAKGQQVSIEDLKKRAPISTVAVLQVNDVYEVEPSEAGTRGGLARIATLRKALDLQHPPLSQGKEKGLNRVLSILPGDFISPSAIGASIEVKNKKHVFEDVKGIVLPVRVAGRQMIEGLRAAGMDIVSFGNHEFDLKYTDKKIEAIPSTALLNRIREFTAPRPLGPKRFPYGTLEPPQWLSGNVRLNTSVLKPEEIPPSLENSIKPAVWNTSVAINKTIVPIKIGVISVCLVTSSKYATFEENGDLIKSAERQIDELKSQGVNAIIAMTHQSMENDRKFADYFKGKIHLIAGGHEHDRQEDQIPYGKKQFITIAKADANAKSAYIHRFHFDQDKDGQVVLLGVESSWIDVNSNIADEPRVRRLTSTAEASAKASFRMSDFTEKFKYAPDRVIWPTVNVLDGRESKIRSQKTHLSELIGRSISARAYRLQRLLETKPEEMVIGSIYHGGTIRIDDQLMNGPAVEALDRRYFSVQSEQCKAPGNCVTYPGGDPSRCEKKVRCPGEITEYDVLRIAPFDGTAVTWITFTGKQIKELYGCNDQNTGTGSYLHFSNFFPCGSNKLCFRQPNMSSGEFALTETIAQVTDSQKYTVASLDYFSHSAIPRHPQYKDIFSGENPPDIAFPKRADYKNADVMRKWILANDIRRALVEEPARSGSWPSEVIRDSEVSKQPTYGEQPPLKGSLKKRPECIYF